MSKLEKTYREMLKESNAPRLDEAKKKKMKEQDDDMDKEDDEEDLDENVQKDSGEPEVKDDDPKVDPEKQETQKKGDRPEKPKDAANRPADDSKQGLAEAKKKMKEQDDDEDDDDDDEEMDESKETPEDRIRRGVPAKKDPLEESKGKRGKKHEQDEKPGVEKGQDLDDEDGEVPGEQDTGPDEKNERKKKLKEHSRKAISEMGSLLESQGDLTEEHRQEVTTLFEAALADRTKIIEKSLHEEYNQLLDEAIEDIESSLVESLDQYLDKIVAEWLNENRLAVESGVKAEITESFLGAMKAVFDDHYVAVPDEKLDLVENILDENEEMEAKLNEEMRSRMEAEAKLSHYQKKEVVDELSEGLTMTERERLAELTEEIDYGDKATFTKKAKTIKEQFLKKVPSDGEPEILNEGAGAPDVDNSKGTARYNKAIARMSTNKFSLNENRSDK